MGDGEHTIAGLAAHLLVGLVSVVEQGLVTTLRQLMEVVNARPTGQVTPKQKAAIPIPVQVLTCPSMPQIGIYWVVQCRKLVYIV